MSDNTDKLDTSYCPACGRVVKVFGLLAEGDMIYRCMQCGMEVDNPDEATPGDTIEKPAAPPAKPKKVEEKIKETAPVKSAGKKLKYVMIAEDSKLLSQLIQDILLDEGYSERVGASLDGDVFIQKFTESMIQNDPPNLIILDINLPVIDGMNICVAIRAIEKAFGNDKGRPILFFTAKQADAQLKKLMETYKPARYVNKGAEGDPEKLAQRIKTVMQTLLKN